MSNDWIKDYNAIKDFIAAHPEIQIDQMVVSIPAEVRPEFYHLFDAVRVGFLKAVIPEDFAEANTLSTNFLKAKEETRSRLKLIRVDVQAPMRVSLENPSSGLVSELFDPLFDLLKGRIDTAGFEKISTGIARKAFKAYFHHGYEYWAALSLICLMAPDMAYTQPIRDQLTDLSLLENEARPGAIDEVSDLVTAETISFDFDRVHPLLVPNVVLHSPSLQTFAAVGVDIHDVFLRARVLGSKVEWLKKEAMRNKFGRHNLWPDTCIYLQDSAEELRVIMDWLNVARPDIIVNVMEGPDWYDKGRLDIVKLQNKALKPRLGSFVVCRHPVPEAASNEVQSDLEAEKDLIARQIEAQEPPERILELSEPIYLLSVGYERANLEPIISAIGKDRIKS